MFKLSPVMLAAGRSRRFGGDKLLSPLTLAGVTELLVVHSLNAWLAVFERLTVVIRPDHPDLLQLLSENPAYAGRLNLVVTEDADKGLGHSLAAAVAATQDASAWLIGLADMPAISSRTLQQSEQLLHQGAALTVPFHRGRQGHPVGFAQQYKNELLQLTGDKGAKSILQRNKDLVHPVTADQGSVLDIDSRADWADFMASFQ